MTSYTDSGVQTERRQGPAPGDGHGAGAVRRRSRVPATVVAIAALLAAGWAGYRFAWPDRQAQTAAAAAPPPPEVTVATPLAATVAPSTSFLGQFSAVDSVELRAQVGGTLTEIGFKDGQVVDRGATLFVIDPRPFQIKLDQAAAQLQTAVARKSLADAQLWRAQQLRQSSFGTVENVDQRTSDLHSAESAIETAKAAIRDAQLDLEFSRVVAPFRGRIGAHQASVGSLISGSRAGAGPSTLLATIVSLDPIHLDFDMSESDYLQFQAAKHELAAGEPVQISLGGDGHYDRRGTLDFIDNVLDRTSGTIHARATVPNPDLQLTPGQFARVRLPLGQPVHALLLPAAAVLPDQSQQIVMTVAADGRVVPKPVRTGDTYRGLRIITAGLEPSDRVIINGLVRVRPGAPVTPTPGTITPTDGAE